MVNISIFCCIFAVIAAILSAAKAGESGDANQNQKRDPEKQMLSRITNLLNSGCASTKDYDIKVNNIVYSLPPDSVVRPTKQSGGSTYRIDLQVNFEGAQKMHDEEEVFEDPFTDGKAQLMLKVYCGLVKQRETTNKAFKCKSVFAKFYDLELKYYGNWASSDDVDWVVKTLNAARFTRTIEGKVLGTLNMNVMQEASNRHPLSHPEKAKKVKENDQTIQMNDAEEAMLRKTVGILNSDVANVGRHKTDNSDIHKIVYSAAKIQDVRISRKSMNQTNIKIKFDVLSATLKGKVMTYHPDANGTAKAISWDDVPFEGTTSLKISIFCAFKTDPQAKGKIVRKCDRTQAKFHGTELKFEAKSVVASEYVENVEATLNDAPFLTNVAKAARRGIDLKAFSALQQPGPK